MIVNKLKSNVANLEVIIIKFYAVKKGRKPGIYSTWPDAQKQISKFPGAVFKSFPTRKAAEDFLNGQGDYGNLTESAPKTDEIIVYTDGGSRNHGNVAGGHVKQSDPAAWAYLIINHGKKTSDTGGEFGATNNRMEIMGLRNALQYLLDNGLNQEHVHIIADSKYVLDAITKGWLAGWKARGFQRSQGELKNRELWQDIDRLLPKFTNIVYSWTKGHADNSGNVFVDELLNQTMDEMMAGKKSSSHVSAKTKATTTKSSPANSKPVTQQKSQGKRDDNPKIKASVDAIKENLRQLGLFDDQ
ncbi:ribonuclease H family protein [Lentilactobacillus sp. SPB1-3]|uniref:Ribonuclease H family protein n=1 Tax=Lentilactobacillus terminaliae TaxID=3003483 RepID=A0ACD5DFS8_9LACO